MMNRQSLRARTWTPVLAAAFATPLMATPEAWRYETEASPNRDLSPEGVLALPEGGFLVSGNTANTGWLVRYSAQGDVVERQALADYGDFASRASVNGRALSVRPPETDEVSYVAQHQACWLQRGPIDLRWFAHWVVTGNPGSGLDADGGQIGELHQYDDDGRIAFTRAVRFGPDCHITELYRSRNWDGIAAIPGVAGAYITENAALLTGEPVVPVLRKFGLEGMLWQRPLAPPPAPGGYSRSYPHVAPNSDVVISTSNISDAAVISRQLIRYDAAGTIQWTKTIAAETNRFFLLPEADASQIVSLAQDIPDTQVVADTAVSIGNDGTTRWTAALDPPHFSIQLPSARKDLPRPWLLKPKRPTIGQATPPGAALVRPGSTGVMPLARLRTDVDYLAELVDGSLLARTNSATDRALRLIRADDSEVAVPNASVPTAHGSMALLSDRDSVFFVTLDETGQADLHHLSERGELRWKIPLPLRNTTTGGHTHDDFALRTSPSRVCAVRLGVYLLDPAEASCYQRGDGRAIYEHAQIPVRRSPQLLMADDGSLDIAGFATLLPSQANGPIPRRAIRVAVAPDGQVSPASELVVPTSVNVDIALLLAKGGKLIALAEYNRSLNKTVLSLLAGDNSRRWQTVIAGRLVPLTIGSDGSMFVQASDGFVDIDGNGQQRWKHAMPDGATIAYSRSETLEPSDDRLVAFGLGRVPPDYKEGSEGLMRLSALDGRAIWQRSTTGPGLSALETQLHSASTARVAWIVRSPRDVLDRALAFDVASGAHVGSVSLPFGDRPIYSNLPGFHLDLRSDGSVLTVNDRTEHGRVALEFHPREHVLGTETDRLQASLLGAWSADDSPGQGLMFDFDPDTRAVFGGWFTYSLDGGHDAAQQRWYSLSPANGGAAADAAQIELAIHRNRGGRFGAAPATTAERIGSAQLRQIGCDRALFVYRFDSAEENQAQGAIPLRRSYARTRACQQAPGEVAGIAHPARGIDPRSAGVWYDPAQSGQGLMFDLRPPQGDDAGLIAGAWFTYDIDGQADDPTAQHWFSLAGDLGSAQDGAFEVPLFRTVGGSLDRGATNNTWRVGTATLKFADCNHARLDYAFDPTELAHAFAGRRGTLALQRVGACGD